MGLLDAGLALINAAEQTFTHPVKLPMPGESTRIWNEAFQEFEMSEGGTIELWAGFGSLQPNLERATSATPGDVGGSPLALGTHRAYLPNSEMVRQALTKDAVYLVDDLNTSLTYQAVFEPLQDAVAMAGQGRLRVQLRVKE